MPYIKKEDRMRYDVKIDEMISLLQYRSIGEVNYIFSRIVWKLFHFNKTYTFGNALVGMLECVKNEFYRRKLSKYEDKKILENGDLPEA
jgi:hypothetical protein